MYLVKQLILSPSCLSCGSLFSDRTLFCRYCYRYEISYRIRKDNSSHLKNLRHRYLLTWVPGESDSISQMVYRMKSDNSVPAWAYYTELLKVNCGLNFKNYSGIIPIPGSRPESRHSQIFARELSRLTDLPVLDILRKSKDETQQKHRSAAERKIGSVYAVRPVITEHFTKYIFVDDILTTGSSFLQAEEALGITGRNLILTLFYRPRPRPT